MFYMCDLVVFNVLMRYVLLLSPFYTQRDRGIDYTTLSSSCFFLTVRCLLLNPHIGYRELFGSDPEQRNMRKKRKGKWLVPGH